MLRVTAHSYADAKACPFRDVLDMLGDKWTFIILAVLEDEAARFNQIRRLIGDISQRVLTSKLRDLERDGYVSRAVFPTSPPCVQYALTEMGRSAIGPITQLMNWSVDNHDLIRAARLQFDRMLPEGNQDGRGVAGGERGKRGANAPGPRVVARVTIGASVGPYRPARRLPKD